MADKPKKKPKPRYVRSEWIFDWKRPEAFFINSWSAILIVGAAFAFALVSVRVKMVEPVNWEAPRASVIHLSGNGWSHALAEEARAQGPFPSRFEPDQWFGAAPLLSFMDQASQPQLKAHQPRLLPFPEPGIQPPRMARRGEPVLPHHRSKVNGQHGVEGLRLLPVITALDGIEAQELPETLPDWDQPVTDELASRPWKFLVELDPSGRVRDCVSLAGGNELSPAELTQWLRGVVFRAEPRDGGRRWVAVAISFQNKVK